MRCRKVRFYLSAYCRDELDGQKKFSIDKHLTNCADCRKEESVFKALSENIPAIGNLKVSDDFNNNLLNRIANERFAETRTKAHFPKRLPLPLWTKAVPAVVSVCLLLFVTVTYYNPIETQPYQDQIAAVSNNLDDSYLTAQPTNNPNLTEQAGQNWSFNNTLARSERISEISRSMVKPGSFYHTATLASSNSHYGNSNSAPYMSGYNRYQPIIRIYIFPQNKTVKEGSGEY